MTTVLIIDACQEHRVLIGRMVNRMNLNALIAKNSQDVVDYIGQVDLVILDLNLSGQWKLDSFGIIAMIRQHDQLTRLPILALATNILPDSKYHNGWDKLMMKPFDISELKNNILDLLAD